jgi:hypothetical protein
VTGLLFASVVAVAAGVWIARGLRTRAAKRAVQTGTGSSVELAIQVRSFDEIDDEVAERHCHCGATLRAVGEGPRQVGDRRYRFVRLACDECEENSVVYFEVSTVLH